MLNQLLQASGLFNQGDMPAGDRQYEGNPVAQGGQSQQGPTFPSVDSTAYNQAVNAVAQMLRQTPKADPAPKPVSPAFRTEDAGVGLAALLAAALGGRGGGEFATGLIGGHLQGKQGKAQADTQMQNQNWQIENQNTQQQYQGDLSAAKFLADAEGDKLNRATNERNTAMTLQANADNKRMVEEGKREASLRNDLNTLIGKYEKATSRGMMDIIAKQIQNVEAKLKSDISIVPDKQGMDADWAQMSSKRVNELLGEWDQAITQAKKGQYGTVTPSALAGLRGLEKSLKERAKAFGVEIALPEPPTERTLEADYKMELQKQAAERNIILRDKADVSILETKAKIQRLKDQTVVDRQRADIAAFNANTARIRAESKKNDTAIERRILSLKEQIRGKESKLKGEKSKSARDAIMRDLEELKGRVGFLREQVEGVGGTSAPSVGTSTFETPSGVKYQFDTSK